MHLSLTRWVRYEPTLPGNLDLPDGKRFYLELLSGMTKAQLFAMNEALKTRVRLGLDGKPRMPTPGEEEEDVCRLAEVAAGVIRLGSEPLTIDGVEVKELVDYLRPVRQQMAEYWFDELFGRLLEINRTEGMKAVFSVRPSGGSSGTPDPSSASKANQPAAP